MKLLKFAKNWPTWEGRENLSIWRSFVGQILPDSIFFIMENILNIRKRPFLINEKLISEFEINKNPYRPARQNSHKVEELWKY